MPSFSFKIPLWLWIVIAALALIFVAGAWWAARAAILDDAAGLAEYGQLWWIVKPVVTGAPCPECAVMWSGVGSPKIPEGLTVQ
jgi:hypothetical protein